MADFTEAQLSQLKSAMQKRYLALQEEIHNELEHVSDSRYIDLTSGFSGIPDDIDTARVDRQVNEMRQLEEALKQLNDLNFGDCIDCTSEIGFERLLAYPAAQRCIKCQKHHDRMYRHEASPTF
ncbi:MAG TPA: TraR/DksA family transcriptional regulator [Nitrosomonas sp.]|nr:TraR/DksA family transcriptional regulator [Nitrosomonas sp.]HMW68868.1 TraR/DksA family transcriptional regulator [Nitrosomonas sp.]HMY60679.1 TraR/DksA family transcriptional regulator [Nitrosomonas sp.]HNA70666.1 TraR/DksA family transcriptional regulator [Nitrosomonas sp.]HNB00482.1 TraR/DksA family transcriptional regulator [Nitrosomonas sp.]